jgi:hypothetical protein
MIGVRDIPVAEAGFETNEMGFMEKELLIPREYDGEAYAEKRPLWIAMPSSGWIFAGVPQWFVAAMRKVQPVSHWWDFDEQMKEVSKAERGGWGGETESAVMVFQDNFTRLGTGWLDHAGWATLHGRVRLVSEPYELDASDMTQLLDFVSRCDLNLNIHGTSYHYPTRTIRIELSAKGPA